MFDTNREDVAKKEHTFIEGRPYEPLSVILGEHQVISGFEEALEDMQPGDTKTVTLLPQKAYGEKNASYVQTFDKKSLNGQSVNDGDVLHISINRQHRTATVVSQTDTGIILDFNHPLVGKTLVFTLEVVSVNES